MFDKRAILLCCLLIVACCIPELLDAQCAMCRAAPESNLTNGGRAGQGLNNGILYMAAVPYFIVGSLGLVWYFNKRKDAAEPTDLR